MIKIPPNKQFSSADVDISFIAALYHPLSIAVDNRAVSIIGMKLWYCLYRSRSSAYTVMKDSAAFFFQYRLPSVCKSLCFVPEKEIPYVVHEAAEEKAHGASGLCLFH